MTRSVIAALIALSVSLDAQAPPPATPPPPDTEVFLAPLTMRDGRPVPGRAENISQSAGYDNQPSFTPDGRAVFFTSIRAGQPPDIYRFDIASAQLTRFTETPESEYSPAVTPDGMGVSVIRVEADTTQRLWRFPIGGSAPRLVLEQVKPVGYHAWLDEHLVALFVLGQPPTLQLADLRTGRADVVASNIGRSLHRIPGRGSLSFVQREAASPGTESAQPPWIMELDPKTRTTTRLIQGLPGGADIDCAWTPDGWLLMARGSTLHGWRLGSPPAWTPLGGIAGDGVGIVSRLAVNRAGDRLALVAQKP